MDYTYDSAGNVTSSQAPWAAQGGVNSIDPTLFIENMEVFGGRWAVDYRRMEVVQKPFGVPLGMKCGELTGTPTFNAG
ncbi:hypothetical protein SY88_16510 [Clostridiales bacterium PH28_bin88]|nr:hypothetical protein SY88_16510 [Clostridiales bacterium PH28_bin88]